MAPNARSVADVHRETEVSEPTLYAWRREFQNRGHAVPANPESWSGRDKLAVVIETAALNEQALSEYCRRKAHPSPHSCEAQDCSERPVPEQHLAESLYQRTQSPFGHHRHQLVEHHPLAE